MKEIGINKRLYDRRLELGYSMKEACIRLDISKLKLSLIENGYRKVKDKKLQQKFIFKYKLEENFFEKNELDYPSPLDDDNDAEQEDSKAVKIFSSLWFKISSIILALGFVAMFSIGVVRYDYLTERDFFSEQYNAAYDYTKDNGTKHLAITAKTSEMLLSDYWGVDYNDPTNEDGFYFESLNFFPKYEEYLGYAFFMAQAKYDLTAMTGVNIGNATVYYESRMTDLTERIHFHVYTEGDLLVPTAHFSVDYSKDTGKFKYNLVEVRGANGGNIKVNEDSASAYIYRYVFETNFSKFTKAKSRYLEANKRKLGFDSLEQFNLDQAAGLILYASYMGTNRAFIGFGVACATIFFALFILSLLVTTKVGKKVYDTMAVEQDKSIGKDKVVREFTPLPKNRWPTPIVPEVLIRIVAFILMVIGSMSIYYIFSAIMNGDIIGTFDSLQYRATVASLSTLGILLIFFIKLDIIENKKSTFLLNFMLFFAGFIFYVLMLLISKDITSSPALNRFSIVLDFLPGNIMWGMLAFNTLTSILLSKPKFKTHEKRNTIIYRLLALIPFGYMIASSLIQIGKKAWGWNLPFEVSSLFFTKALIITAFSILYVLVIYVYRKIIDHKFGKENAETYVLGNRYQYIKNLLIAFVFVILGVADLLLGKTTFGSKMGFGAYSGIFYLIPVILLYHPHRGPRNKKWDIVFNAAYGFSMMIGILCIIGSIGVYITSL